MKASIPQGTRDFGPEVVRKRNYLFQIIRTVFEQYGFQPLETPAFENLDTLMGKYGEEGDKLIFKILNNGLDRPEKKERALADFKTVLDGKNNKGITERALKYDLTIPFARYVAMHHAQLSVPFKRYQIQNVWRADRPQRGRYREFTQCDADVVGSVSLLNEVELIQIYAAVFKQLGLNIEIRINHRKILAGLAEGIQASAQLSDLTVAIDKLDKIGVQGVTEELQRKGFSETAIASTLAFILPAADETGSLTCKDRLKQLRAMDVYTQSPLMQTGVAELEVLAQWAETLGITNLVLDTGLARGLNYYTGVILEIKPLGIQMGSLGGGGRYDDLTGLFDVPGIPGVGISFGVDRIYDVMEELQLFPADLQQAARFLIIHTGAAYEQQNLALATRLREQGQSCELFPDALKFDKQMKYANRKGFAYVILQGESEVNGQYISVKNFNTGEQKQMQFDELLTL